jgi:hypothetical protein
MVACRDEADDLAAVEEEGGVGEKRERRAGEGMRPRRFEQVSARFACTARKVSKSARSAIAGGGSDRGVPERRRPQCGPLKSIIAPFTPMRTMRVARCGRLLNGWLGPEAGSSAAVAAKTERSVLQAGGAATKGRAPPRLGTGGRRRCCPS